MKIEQGTLFEGAKGADQEVGAPTEEKRLRNKRNGVVMVYERTRVYNNMTYLTGTVVDVGRTGYYLGQVYGDLEKNWEIEP
jgi:hypothetical protein